MDTGGRVGEVKPARHTKRSLDVKYHICTETLNALEYSLKGAFGRYRDAELEGLADILRNRSNVIVSDIITALEHIEKIPIEAMAELLEKNRLLQNVIAIIGKIQQARKADKESPHLFDLCKEAGS